MATGWLREQEDLDFLRAETAATFAAPPDFSPPPSMSFRSILHVEDQGNMSSCVGHGGSSGLEALEYIANGGRVQMSRMAMYLLAQRASGITGDRGATISGCVKAMLETGCCEETEFPYPSRYGREFPQPALQAAGRHKILGHQKLTTYREVFDWISQGKGPVVFGMTWYERVANTQGLITPDDLRGRSLGGHCKLFCGYSGERDEDGQLLIDDINSHGSQWGEGGWAKWTSRAIDALGNDRNTEMIGITDITGFDPDRLINFAKIV
jgi:hypothetical protein